MKTKIYFIHLALFLISEFYSLEVKAQTYASGNQTNNCGTAAGTAGASNTTIGCGAGGSVTNGLNNTFVGRNAGFSTTNGGYNVGVGVSALYTQASAAGFDTYNVAVGNEALFYNLPSTSTNGQKNTAFGFDALTSNTTGTSNTGTGAWAGRRITTGTNNTFIGFGAGEEQTTVSENMFVGYNAGNKNAGGTCNVFIGLGSGELNTSGAHNTYLGFKTGQQLVTQSYNTFGGYQAGDNFTTGDHLTFLGKDADASGGGYTNATALGLASTLGSHKIYVGNASSSKYWCQVGWSFGSDRRIKNNIQQNVPGLKFIKLLNPVTFHFDVDKENELTGWGTHIVTDSSGGKTVVVNNFPGKYDIEKTQFSGFIAQEVDSAAQKIGYDFSGVGKDTKMMSLNYSQFIAPLVKAVQELDETIDSLQAEANQLQNTENGLQVELSNDEEMILYQNEPNPFDANTVIRYFIPENTNGAFFIVFYNEEGKEIKKIELTKGFGKIDIASESLIPGMYSYSMLVGGRVVDTKKMIRSR